MFPQCFSLVVAYTYLLSEKQRPHTLTSIFIYCITLYLGLNKDDIALFSEKVAAVYIYCEKEIAHDMCPSVL